MRHVQSPQNEDCVQSLPSFLVQLSCKQTDFQETFSTDLRGFLDSRIAHSDIPWDFIFGKILLSGA